MVDARVQSCWNRQRFLHVMRFRFASLLSLAFCFASVLHAEPVSLFDGKTLDGWDYDPAMWRVEDGMITGGSRTEKITHNDFICTKKNYQNFDLKLKIKVSGDPKTGLLNSGIQIRSRRVPGGAHMSGYQVDCGEGWFGKIYDEFRRNKVIAEPVDAAALAKVVDVAGWNEYHIRAEGPRIQTWINGVKALDYTEADKNVALDGQLGPQVHSGGVCLVQLKDITIEELPPTPGAPTWDSLGGVEAARKLIAPPPAGKSATTTSGGRDISYNNVQGVPRTAAEEKKLFKLPPDYEIELVAQESEGIGKFVSVYFDQRGRLWTQTALEYPVDANENPAAAEAVYAGKGKDKVLVYPREALNAPLPADGLKNPTVFCDGLAIPLGILPWGNGDQCYVQHGHDLKLFKDTNGDGKADNHEVILTGFGVQDSHLFPHQFTRARGGWIWMAQGLFNNSQVKHPGDNAVTEWPMCSMARLKPDGSQFEVTSVGPNNIWGLATTPEGETFIQEANDYGYPVMPFHEYAYYPGGTERIKRSYQPDFPPAASFRMGGTGLSGLALGGDAFRKLTPTVKDDGLTMFVANPITSKVQTIAMNRDGEYWQLEQAPDLLTSDDPFFRPVAMTMGPDGCLYLVDWYNKIISHNEVPRAHPDRDKTRGRIWRIRPKAQKSSDVPDMTKFATEDMLDYLESSSVWAQSMASQILADRKAKDLLPTLKTLVNDENKSASTRIHALWAWEEIGGAESVPLAQMLKDSHRSIRREAIRVIGTFAKELGEAQTLSLLKSAIENADGDSRRAIIQVLGTLPTPSTEALSLLISFAKPSLPGPLATASRGAKQIPIREAYDREFERFLVRMFLERQPTAVAAFLDTPESASLPVEAQVLAALALEPKTSATRVARLLPKLDRTPNDEELLRLAQFPEESGCGEALKALLLQPKTRVSVAEKLLAQKTKLNPAKIAPLLAEPARAMLPEAGAGRTAAVNLIGAFQIAELESDLVALLGMGSADHSSKATTLENDVNVLQALRDMRSGQVDVFARIAVTTAAAPQVRDAALAALSASRNPDAATRLLALYPQLEPSQKKTALSALSTTRAGAKTIVASLLDKSLPQTDLDGPTAERLATVLEDDPALAQLQQQLGGVFRDVLLLDGQDTAAADSQITLEGPFTVECWVRLAEDVSNHDSILCSPKQIDLNFFQSKFRVWVGINGLNDVAVAKKPITPELWTHMAVTRDAKGTFRIYQNGELDSVGTKPSMDKFENCRIGLSGPNQGGTKGAISEFRVWKKERSATEIRASFDRIIASAEGMKRYDGAWGKLGAGARVAKTLDVPPLLTEEQAVALDTKFQRYSALAKKTANLEKGKMLSSICMACHQIGNAGGQIGPNLSGAGAMGLEAVLRNILTPNAAMEPGYRIFRMELVNGDLLDAFYVSEDKEAYIVRQPGLPDKRLPRSEVRSTRYIRRSLMPEGLLDALSEDQVTDLLGYLMTLK